MHNIENNQTFYLFDCKLTKFTKKFENKDDLVDFISHNPFILNELNMNGKDCVKETDYNGNELVCLRQYLFIDSDNRIIDIRKFIPEIEKALLKKTKEKISDFSKGDKLSSSCTGNFVYRESPVPHLRKKRRIRCFRRMKTIGEKRICAIPEEKAFVRKSRNSIPTYYDDRMRSFSKSWKDQHKVKYQWEKPQK